MSQVQRKSQPKQQESKLPSQLEDRWSKFMLGRVLSLIAPTETGAEMLSDVFRVAVLFCPDQPSLQPPSGAGLLLSLCQERRCVIEPYSGAVKNIFRWLIFKAYS